MYVAYINNPKLPQARMEAVRLLEKDWSKVSFWSGH